MMKVVGLKCTLTMDMIVADYRGVREYRRTCGGDREDERGESGPECW